MNTLSFTEKKSGQLQHTALTWDSWKKSGDGSIADESGEVDEGIAYKTYKP